MKFGPGLFAVMFLLLANGASLASGDDSLAIDADVSPQMVAEEVETLVRSFTMGTTEATEVDGDPKVSVRCTRADRLGAFRNEKGEIDTRTVWVAEVEGRDGADGAFYVLDDETGEVLAHGVVAAPVVGGGGE